MCTVRIAVACTVVVATAGLLAGCGGDNVQVVSGNSAPASEFTPSGSSGQDELPPMADGENLDACKDGTCQVVVTAPADFDVRGVRTSVSVDGRRVTVKQRSGGSTSSITVSGTNGLSTIGTGDGSVTLRLRGVSGDKVALDISYRT